MNKLKEPIETYDQLILNFANYVDTRKLYPILKWAGGKEQELKHILPNLPDFFQDYYEPFVGGGAVYTAIQAKQYFINDRSEELISLYLSITDSNRETFFKSLYEIIDNWDCLTSLVEEEKDTLISTYKDYADEKFARTKLNDIITDFIKTNADTFESMFSGTFNFNAANFIRELQVNLERKLMRMKKIERLKGTLPYKDILDNIEAAIKSAYYMQFRHIYNKADIYGLSPALKSSIFLFIRNFAYSGMFRYNSNGEFNVPFGGIGYNRKNFRKKVDYLKSEELKSLLDKTIIEKMDFESFLELHKPTKKDFVFLDPPYDSVFSNYARNDFSKEDHERLANYLINRCEGLWMLIIKNTDFIYNLYSNKGLNIMTFGKKYLVSFMNRNEKKTEHLLIKNY